MRACCAYRARAAGRSHPLWYHCLSVLYTWHEVSAIMRILTVPVGPLQANCYLVADDGGIALAIDPGGEPERLISTLEREGMRLTHILLTHGHFDHLAGAAGLAEFTGARIACSEGTAPMLRNPDDYIPVSYTHLRAHETVLDLVCRLL